MQVDKWSVSLRKLYRHLLLRDLSGFLPPDSAEAASPRRLIYAAPEADDFLRWRAILCGSGRASTRTWRDAWLSVLIQP
jgi:hypothetical protein